MQRAWGLHFSEPEAWAPEGEGQETVLDLEWGCNMRHPTILPDLGLLCCCCLLLKLLYESICVNVCVWVSVSVYVYVCAVSVNVCKYVIVYLCVSVCVRARIFAYMWYHTPSGIDLQMVKGPVKPRVEDTPYV